MTLPTFHDPSLLTTALTHRSALNEQVSDSPESNERMEFLGDAVLELATTRYLYTSFPTEPEGVLTSYRSALVKTTTLAEMARELELGQRLLMSKGEEATGGRENDGLLADTTEAVLGALYLDQGFEAVEAFLAQHLFPKFVKIKKEKLYKDAKSLLQETVQGRGLPTPEYQLLEEVGPDHDKIFTIEVLVNGVPVGQGTGKSKQIAQQAAAREALNHFEEEAAR